MTRTRHAWRAAFAATAIALAVLATGTVRAQTYPSRPVTLVVPYATGGGTDAIARTLAKALSEHWKQPVVVENRVGADGWLGTQRVLGQPGDGYTILLQLNSLMLWKWSLPEANFDVFRDMRVISKVQSSPMVAAIRGDSSAKNLKEFMEECKRQTTPCSFGTSTVSAYLTGKQLMELGGVHNAIRVPYKGTAPMMTDLLGGHISMALISATFAVPLTLDQKIKSIGVGSATRYARLPATPTFVESDIPVHATTWYGLMVKRDTPDAAFRAIVDAVKKIATQPDVLKTIESQGFTAVFGTPEEFEQDIRQESSALTALGEKYLAGGTK